MTGSNSPLPSQRPVQPASDLHETLVDRVDRIMSFAEVIPWGGRWAARIPNVIGYTIEADHVDALAELRKEVIADLEGVSRRLEILARKEIRE